MEKATATPRLRVSGNPNTAPADRTDEFEGFADAERTLRVVKPGPSEPVARIVREPGVEEHSAGGVIDLVDGSDAEVIDLADGRLGSGVGTRWVGPELDPADIEAYVRSRLDSLDVEIRSSAGPIYHFFKRVLDLVIAIPALVLTAPVMAVLAILIRRESPGPAVFRQQRIGRGGRVFTFYKFRTMYVDAKERFPELYDYNFDSAELASRYYKHADDPRNTPLGAFLRRSTLDELPNLVNVLKGDISIVGFRPELPQLVRHYEPYELAKFNVKAGLACKSECTGRNTNTIKDQITLDLEYVADQSMRLDLWVIAQTLKMVVKGIGAE
ncbi:MAG: sugar transferase [Microthrixaceae bacterium]